MVLFHKMPMNTKTLFVAIAIVAAFSVGAVGFAGVTSVSAMNHTSGNMSAGNMTAGGGNMSMTMADNMTTGG
jgi:hypothetical protein